MPDAALSVASSSLSALLTTAPADSGAKAHATARADDPFAALLAGAAGDKPAPAPGKAHAADPVTVQPADKPAVASVPAAATAAAATAAATATATNAEQMPTADAAPADPEHAPHAAHDKKDGGDEDDADDADDADDGSDRLADAIASGATAVLALAPAIVTPVQTQAPPPPPVDIDAPVTIKPLKPGSAILLHPRLKAANVAETADAATASGQPATAVEAQVRTAPSIMPAPSGSAVAVPAEPRLKSDDAAKAADPGKPQAQPVQIATPAQPGSRAAQADADASQSQHRQPQPATDAAPAATQLSPEVAKAVTAMLLQSGDAPATATADPANPVATTPAVVTAAQAQFAQQNAEPTAEPVKQARPQADAAAAPAPTARRRSEEAPTPAPRRAADPRKRTILTATEAASADAAPRAAETAHPAASLATGNIQDKSDALVQQTLSIARDGAWLDRLARDIANAGKGGDLQFKLDPQNLGGLSVAIRQGADGASIRLTADNAKTRDILVDAQPKLIAEAHAQGLKIADTQVDVRQDQNRNQNQSSNQDAQRWGQNGSGQNNMSQNGQNRQSSPGHQPFVSNLRRKAEAKSESPDRDSDVLYA